MAITQQPGSEQYSQLEVTPTDLGDEAHPKFADLRESNQKFIVPDSREQGYQDGPFEPAIPHRSFWRRKRVWLVVIAVVVIAAVVGGAVGGTKNSKSSAAASSTGPVPTASSTPTMSGSATALSSYLYPTALSWGHPHLEVLAIGPSNNTVYWKYRPENATSTEAWDPQDSSLALVGGQIAAFEQGVAAVARSTGSVDIFVVGIPSTSYGVFHKAHNASMVWDPAGYDPWYGLGGSVTSGPTVVSWDQHRMDVFAMGAGPNYALFQLTWQEENGWSAWTQLGGSWSTFAPTAVSWGEGRIDVFTINPVTKALYHAYWDGSIWQPLNSFDVLGGYCTSRPIAVSWGAGRIDLFVRGGDAGLWHMSYSANAWSKWASISGNSTIQGEPDAVSWGANRLDVFAWASDGSLLHKSYDGTTNTWSPSTGFESIGQGLTGPPKSVSDAAGSVHVFAYAHGAEIVHKAWNQTVGAWRPASGFEALGTP